jgi:hypothetical protein
MSKLGIAQQKFQLKAFSLTNTNRLNLCEKKKTKKMPCECTFKQNRFPRKALPPFFIDSSETIPASAHSFTVT